MSRDERKVLDVLRRADAPLHLTRVMKDGGLTTARACRALSALHREGAVTYAGGLYAPAKGGAR
jgi:DNA-binding IclR family transcriptional regulator